MTLADGAHRRLVRMYGEAFGETPPAARRWSHASYDVHGRGDAGLLSIQPASIAPQKGQTPPRGFRIAPIELTDGLFEHAFRVFEIDERPVATDVIFVFARNRWPVFIGEAGDTFADEVNKRREQARIAGADEMWICQPTRRGQAERQRIQLGLLQVYKPALNGFVWR